MKKFTDDPYDEVSQTFNNKRKPTQGGDSAQKDKETDFSKVPQKAEQKKMENSQKAVNPKSSSTDLNVPKVTNQLNQKVEGNKGSPDQTLKEMKQHQQHIQTQTIQTGQKRADNKVVNKDDRKFNNNINPQ